MRTLLAAAAALLLGGPAAAADGPAPSDALYCMSAKDEILRMDMRFSDLIDAYQRKTGWGYATEPVAPDAFRVIFAAGPETADEAAVTFHTLWNEGHLAVESIDYRWDGALSEQVPKGMSCLRLATITRR